MPHRLLEINYFDEDLTGGGIFAAVHEYGIAFGAELRRARAIVAALARLYAELAAVAAVGERVAVRVLLEVGARQTRVGVLLAALTLVAALVLIAADCERVLAAARAVTQVRKVIAARGVGGEFAQGAAVFKI